MVEIPEKFTWTCGHRVVIHPDELTLSVESALYKENVRRTPDPGVFQFGVVVEATGSIDAVLQATETLFEILERIGVVAMVVDTRAVISGPYVQSGKG